MTDLISVLISAYNHERYVEECIRSIMDQTYQNIELLVIDDGSKDDTFKILQSLESECAQRFSRVVFRTQGNSGTCVSLNRMLDEAKGEYIYPLASDDAIKPQAIEKLYHFLSQNKDYVLAVGDNEIIDGNSNRIYWGEKRTIVPKEKAKSLTVGDDLKLNPPECNHPDFGSYSDLLKGNYIPNGFLIPKQALFDIGKYNPDMYLEDWYMNLQLSKRGKFKYFPEILYSYRWHGSNTVSSPEFRKKMKEVYRHIYTNEKEYAFSHGYEKLWKKLWSKHFGWRAQWNRLHRFLRRKK